MSVLIRSGDRSSQVSDVQARLRALGFVIDDEAGEFGDSTKHAVRAFQQRRGILADGIVGPNTWQELVEASWRLGDRTLYLRHPLVRGDDVASLQASLSALGFDAGREDGIFGPDTADAVRAFQKEYGVAEDGIFGPTSLAALKGLRVDRPGTAAALREELRLADGSNLQDALIVIDPGHGGDDRGRVGVNGMLESDVCWDIAQRLAHRLGGWGARVRFTRTENECPDASERARRANELDADIFMSLHLNAHDEASAEGASTYFFKSSRAGELLADLVQEHLLSLGARNCRSHPQSYQLLKETRMPAVIVEPCFITNPDEIKRLDDPSYLARLVDAVATAIRRYYANRM